MESVAERAVCVEKLRRRIARLETGRRATDVAAITTGCDVLDNLLPEKGLRRGSLVEWLSPGDGTGAGTLALLAACAACSDGRAVVVLDHRREFCPTAAVRLGIEPSQLIVVHAESLADNQWAADQALRSPAVAAVVAWPKRLDDRTFRRWQLAAEEGGTLGLLIRPETARHEPSWADVRFWIEPFVAGTLRVPSANTNKNARLLRIVLLRCRGASDSRSIDVEFDDETHCMYPLAIRRRQIAQ
jgi:protein ImuA